MKISLITDGLYPYVLGGMQRHSAALSQELVEQGVELHLFHTVKARNLEAEVRDLKGFEYSFKNAVHAHFIPFPEVGMLPGHYVRELRAYSNKVFDCFCRTCPDCDFIYAQGLTGLAFVESRKKGNLRIPVGVNVHGYEMYQYAANLREKLAHYMLRPSFRWLNQNADYVFSFSGKIRSLVENKLRVSPSRILEIPNAVGNDWLVDKARGGDEKIRFLFVGRYERRKGIEELSEAIQGISNPDVEFHFIGPIEETRQLRDERCIYHGKVTDIDVLKALYDHCDVLLCPSYAEGMPTVILEAMARGLAIIATNVGAVAEVVDEVNGILLEKPTVALLRAALYKISELPDHKLSLMKRESLRKVADFTWEKVALKTHRAIQSCLVNAGEGRK